MSITRREFLVTLAAGTATVVVAPAARAQGANRNTTGNMNQNAYLPVQLPAKPNARPLLTSAQRDALEHKLHCQCGCGLDVFTCRTTDFTCSVSPAMHVDVMGLIAGGYDAREILTAFQRVYGERVLMEPVKEGFNLVGYLLPFVALGGGAALVATLIRRWSRPAPAAPAPFASASDATPAELARLRDALRNDE